MRRATITAAVAVAVAFASSVADAGRPARRHRLKLPAAELATTIAVDEGEYYIRPSEPVVAAGLVTIHAYNRGQDDHDIQFHDSAGAVHEVPLKPGAGGTLTAKLKPGTYRFVCSLFAGTSQSHEALGMHFVLKVQ